MMIKEVSEKTGINARTLKRWKEKGINRRSFSGRRSLAPDMEENLCKWIYEMKKINLKIAKKDIISKAL